ncbi:MAG: C25 family cysteine peptidase [Acidobacteriota bacterium]
MSIPLRRPHVPRQPILRRTPPSPPSLLAATALGVLTALAAPSPAVAGGTPASGTVADELLMITGSESKTEDGDYITANDGLDSFHQAFIEVPAGTSRLVVDLFDMDLLRGIDDGANSDEVNERDRIRRYALYLADPIGNFNDRVGMSIARYELYDPSGARVITKRIRGSHFAPGDADNAWVGFYDSATADTSAGDQFLDTFSLADYGQNDGAVSFAGAWVEDEQAGIDPTNTGAGPGSGLIRISGGQLLISDLGDFSPDLGREPRISRQLDLSAYTSAVLSFDFFVPRQVERPDAIVIELSADGGATWTIIDDFSGYEGVDTPGSRSYDISEFIAANTVVRFRVENIWAGSSETLAIDNFEIRATSDVAAAPAPGVWQLRVDVSSTANEVSGFNGDETNAYGVRAHDGDPSAGGAEIPVFTSVQSGGVNPNDSGRDYTLYPYVTGGCSFDVQDFDWDSDLPNNTVPDPDIVQPFGSIDSTSPSGAFTHANAALSPNDTWSTEVVGPWSDHDTVDDYGVWTLDYRVEDPIDGNYVHVHADTYDAPIGVPPPGSSDPPGSFRLYLPTDAGGAPVKATLSQYLTFLSTQPSGASNPPGPGEIARYAVSVLVTHPDGALGDLEFSPTRTVTARFPGGGVTYRGNAQVTQGTIVSQPVVGSTTAGDIVWNPGTVPAGSGSDSIARLTYQVDVTAPLVAPWSIEVTGAPGSNGTTAVFLDETGVTEFTLGELCQLRVDDATPVAVVAFAARSHAEGLELAWRTAGEATAVRYELVRLGEASATISQRTTVARVGAVGDLRGGLYRALDASVGSPVRNSDRPLRYLVVEHTSDGRRIEHGPFAVEPTGDSFASVADPPSAAAEARRAAVATRASSTDGDDDRANAAKSPSSPRWRPRVELDTVFVSVREEGLHRIDVAELASLWQLPESTVRILLRSDGLQLVDRLDQPVPWVAAPGFDGLDFWVDGSWTDGVDSAFESPFHADEVYRLVEGAALPMERLDPLPPPLDWSDRAFVESVRAEQNLRQVVLLPLDPESDLWFWDFVRGDGGQARVELPVVLPDPAPDDPSLDTVTLRVDLQGASLGAHELTLRWNGDLVATPTLVDHEQRQVETTVDAALLRSGVDATNVLEVESNAGGIVFIDGYDVVYPRHARARDDQLVLRSTALGLASPATVTGLSGAARLFDVSDGARPRQITRLRMLPDGTPGSWRAVWNGEPGARYAVVGPLGPRSPSLRLDRPSDLLQPHHAVDYLIVTTAALRPAAERLAAHRAAQGLDVLVADVQDIYDEVAGGVTDPRALREFLRQIRSLWQRAPRFVVLAGHGSYDYRDHLGLGGNLLPPLLDRRDDSVFPTDAPFADLEADDGVPELALGRIPALDATELDTYIDKVIAYERALDDAGALDWDHRLLLVADDSDGGGDFTAHATHLDSLLSAGFDGRVLAVDALGSTATRQALLAGWAEGAAFVSYSGHGSIVSLANPALLTTGDVATLAATGPPTVLSALTCYLGLHAAPGIDSLAEDLLLASPGGLVAALAPASLSEQPRARLLEDRLVRRLTQRGETLLGEALLGAFEDLGALEPAPDLLRSIQLLGDPALRLQLRPEPLEADCAPSCGGAG